jgi:hypothetical protein
MRPVGDRLGHTGIELAIEVQEGQAVNHGPDGCRQGVRVGAGKGAQDERADYSAMAGAISESARTL